MSLGSKAVGDEFVNGQERSFAARKQYITNLKTPLFQLLKSLWVKCPKTFRLEGISHFFTLSPFHLYWALAIFSPFHSFTFKSPFTFSPLKALSPFPCLINRKVTKKFSPRNAKRVLMCLFCILERKIYITTCCFSSHPLVPTTILYPLVKVARGKILTQQHNFLFEGVLFFRIFALWLRPNHFIL